MNIYEYHISNKLKNNLKIVKKKIKKMILKKEE